jgi:hypothetical protein
MVFILDTICSPELYEQRCRFIKEVLDVVRMEMPTRNQLRVSVVSYGMHAPARPPNRPKISSSLKLTADLSLIHKFLHERGHELGNVYEAAFERALLDLYRLEWDRSSRRVAISVGQRPPHPYRRWLRERGDPLDCYNQPHSPLNCDWRLLLTGIRSLLRVHFISVVCPTYWPAAGLPAYADKYASTCWHEIGYTAVLRFNSAQPADVALIALDGLSAADL